MTEEIEITFPIDEDGFISRECPYCKMRFKIHKSDFENEKYDFEEIYCPYCKQTAGKDEFWTTEQEKYIGDVLNEEFIEPEFEKFAKQMKRLNRKSGLLKIKVKEGKKSKPIQPEEIDNMVKVKFSCCDIPLKVVSDWGKDLYCISCGDKLALDRLM